MKITLRVDNREPDELKRQIVGEQKAAIEFCNLPAGDFAFVDTETQKTLLCIERKEIQDLCASLVDGRFDEQKTKLSLLGSEETAIAYLIEGSPESSDKQSAIETCVLTTRFRDGFFVLHSTGIADTCKLMHRIGTLYERGKMNPLSSDELHRRFIAARSSHRSQSFCKVDNWWAVSLGQIPGIGPQASRAIAQVYCSPAALIDAYRSCNGDEKRMSELLQDIKYVSANQKTTRRLGPKASETVWKTVWVADTRESNMITTPPKKKNTAAKKVTKSEEEPPCMFVDDD